MSKDQRVFVVVPNYRPVGGTAKMLDYAVHAARAGYEVIFAPIGDAHRNSGLLEKPYYTRSAQKIGFTNLNRADFRDGDTILFSLPSNFNRIMERAARLEFPELRLIHVVQNVRHNNPLFDGGFARQMLMKSMCRICITDQVEEAVKALAPDNSQTHLNMHGFDYEFFKAVRKPKNGRLRIGYNLFKSDFGTRVEAACLDKALDVEFLNVRPGVTWEELRQFYHDCDVFVGTPLKEEGYYLPGIEALSGGCLLLCPDAVGNRSYLVSEACSQVEYENVDAYIRSIERILNMDLESRAKLQQSAIRFASSFSLENEFAGFAKIAKHETVSTDKKA